MVQCTYEIISKEELWEIKEKLKDAGYEFRTFSIEECDEKQRYLNGIGKEGEESKYVEVEFIIPQDPHIKSHVTGRLKSGETDQDAEDARSTLERIYQEVIDKRAPTTPAAPGSSHAQTRAKYSA